MDHGKKEHTQLRQGQNATQLMEFFGIRIECVPLIHGQIAEEVNNEESAETQSGDGHHHLFTDRCADRFF